MTKKKNSPLKKGKNDPVGARSQHIKSLEKMIDESSLSIGEVKTLLNSKSPTMHRTIRHDFGKNHIKFMVVSDQHFGSKYTNLKAHDASVQASKKESVDLVFMPGDILEGMSGRDGHIYELSHLGATKQLNLAEDLLKQYDMPLMGITGNHDDWYKTKNNGGLIVGKELERRVPNFTFMGEYFGIYKLTDGVNIHLTHRGNSAYALSYSGQKRINSLQGGTKPNIILNGHLHKSLYMFYRNIQFIESGTLQAQTPFLAMKGSDAHVGFWIIDAWYNSRGVTRFKPEWVPIYKK